MQSIGLACIGVLRVRLQNILKISPPYIVILNLETVMTEIYKAVMLCWLATCTVSKD